MSDTPPTDPPADDPAQLRSKLDKALTENRQLKIDNALHQGGLGHLSDVQRQALMLTVPKGTELTADAMKAQATALGFPLEVAPSTPPPGNEPPPPATGDQTPPPEVQPGQLPPTFEPGTNFLTPAPNSAHPDPRVAASIEGLTQQETAHIMAMRGGQGDGSFEEQIGKATTKAETLAVIRQLGPNTGILLDSDLD